MQVLTFNDNQFQDWPWLSRAGQAGWFVLDLGRPTNVTGFSILNSRGGGGRTVDTKDWSLEVSNDKEFVNYAAGRIATYSNGTESHVNTTVLGDGETGDSDDGCIVAKDNINYQPGYITVDLGEPRPVQEVMLHFRSDINTHFGIFVSNSSDVGVAGGVLCTEWQWYGYARTKPESRAIARGFRPDYLVKCNQVARYVAVRRPWTSNTQQLKLCEIDVMGPKHAAQWVRVASGRLPHLMGLDFDVNPKPKPPYHHVQLPEMVEARYVRFWAHNSYKNGVGLSSLKVWTNNVAGEMLQVSLASPTQGKGLLMQMYPFDSTEHYSYYSTSSSFQSLRQIADGWPSVTMPVPQVNFPMRKQNEALAYSLTGTLDPTTTPANLTFDVPFYEMPVVVVRPHPSMYGPGCPEDTVFTVPAESVSPSGFTLAALPAMFSACIAVPSSVPVLRWNATAYLPDHPRYSWFVHHMNTAHRFTGTVTGPVTGPYRFTLGANGLAILRINGEERVRVYNSNPYEKEITERSFAIDLVAGVPNSIEILYANQIDRSGLHLEWSYNRTASHPVPLSAFNHKVSNLCLELRERYFARFGECNPTNPNQRWAFNGQALQPMHATARGASLLRMQLCDCCSSFSLVAVHDRRYIVCGNHPIEWWEN